MATYLSQKMGKGYITLAFSGAFSGVLKSCPWGEGVRLLQDTPVVKCWFLNSSICAQAIPMHLNVRHPARPREGGSTGLWSTTQG